MVADPLSVAVLGLGPEGQLLLEAAQASGRLHVKAVGDPDRQRVERAAAQYGCDAYIDYRRLIVQNQLDGLLVAADLHTCDEQLKAAIRRKFHVLKLAPPARSFAETVEYAELADNEHVRFTVANPARFRSSFRLAHEWIVQGRISQAFLVAAQSFGGIADKPGWHNDPKLAGGGVLLHNGYQIVDQILWSFPVPQQVYALNSSQAPDKQQRLYLTEDTSVVAMKFNDTLTGNIVTTRSSHVATESMRLTVHGKGATLTVTDNQLVLKNLCDQSDETESFQESERDIMVRLLDGWAGTLRTGKEQDGISSLAENLKNMAVLESAYLSARTGFPEEPGRVLQRTKGPGGAGAAAM